MKHSFSQFKRSLLSLAAFLLSAVTAFAQSTVTGVVRDEFGDGIIGANVIVKGTTNGGTTDLDGNFRCWETFSASMLATFIFSL